MPMTAAAARGTAGLACLVGGLLLSSTPARAVDCTSTIPASLLNDRLTSEVSGKSCEAIKGSYARALGDQAALLARLRPAYARRLGTTAAGASAPRPAEVQAALGRFDADVARLTSMAAEITSLRLPPPATRGGAGSASSALSASSSSSSSSSSASSASGSAASLADLLLESGRLGKDLNDRIAKDTQGFGPAEVDAFCRLDHHLQFGRAVHGKLFAGCLPAD